MDVTSFHFSADADAARLSFTALITSTLSHKDSVLRVLDNIVSVFDDIDDSERTTRTATWLELTTREASAGVVTLPVYTGHGVVPNAMARIVNNGNLTNINHSATQLFESIY